MSIHFPSEPPREWRASIALIASVLGAVAFTVFSAWLVWVLWQGGWPIETAPERITFLGKALMLSLSGSLVVLITLGFAINRSTVKVGPSGIEASGGEGEHND